MSIWRLLLLLPMTTTKTHHLPSYPRPRGSHRRPSGRPKRRRRRRAGRRPLARRRAPRHHHHPRRHRHHFFLLSKVLLLLVLLSLSSLSRCCWTKIAGKRRERERVHLRVVFARLWAKRERERLERCCCRRRRCRCSFFFLCVCTSVRRRGSLGRGEREEEEEEEEEGSLQREETRIDSLFFGSANRHSSLTSFFCSLSLFSKRSPKKDTNKRGKEEREKEKTKKKNTHRSLGSFFCVF